MRLAHLDWPFFDDAHRRLAVSLAAWSAATLRHADDTTRDANDARVVALVRALGDAGWTRYAVPRAWGGAPDFDDATLDSRALCLIRETLAYHDGLADFAFAMQGLGSGAITLGGSDALKDRYLRRVADGTALAAFALSEPDAGSDVAAMSTRARLGADGGYVLDGSKTWISNGGIADFYTVFARTSDAPGARGIGAFVVDRDNPGLEIAARIDVIAPHPLATLTFTGCVVPATHVLGPPGDGFKLAMRTLDIFRASVAAAALGFARRAFDEARERARTRRMFGQTLGDFQLTQCALADMATDIDAAALLTYRAAWQRDVLGTNTTREAAMAKLTATESAQRVIDRALQMFGGAGVAKGNIVESLYREIRALRIYEGASEVQRLIIGRDVLREAAPTRGELATT